MVPTLVLGLTLNRRVTWCRQVLSVRFVVIIVVWFLWTMWNRLTDRIVLGCWTMLV